MKELVYNDGYALSYAEMPLSMQFSGDLRGVVSDKKEDMLNHPHLWKKGYKKQFFKSLEDVANLLRSNFRCISAGFFESGEAKNDNWLGQCFLILDVDDGLTLEEAKKRFSGYECVIATTRNHQKEKNGEVCDRFRVLLPTAEPIECDKETYTEAMSYLLSNEFSFADKACKDVSRIFFTRRDSEIIVLHGGKYFDFEDVLKVVEKVKKLKTWAKEKEEKQVTQFRKNNNYANNFETKKEWYEANWLTDKMAEKLKRDVKYVQGNRNNALYAWGRHLRDDVGLGDEQVREALLWLDRGELGEVELKVFKSLRIA